MKSLDRSALTVYDSLREVVAARPGAIALQYEARSLTYTEFLELVERAAAFLRSEDIGPGDRVMAFAQNSPELLLAYFAAAKLGAVYVPVNPNMAAAEVRYICEHSEAKLVLHEERVADVVEAIGSVGRRYLLSRLTSTDASDESVLAPSGAITRESDFLICYTSGTTGFPKAVVLDHGSQVDACASFQEFWGLTDADVTLVALPLGYLFGLTTASAAGLLSGGLVVLLPKYRPKDVLETMVRQRVTVFHGVPTMFTMMLEFADQNQVSFDLSNVRQLICAGAPLADDIAQRFASTFGKALQNYYAATECSPVIGRPDSHRAPLPAGSIGRLAPGASVRVVAPDGEDCPVGEVGEFYVRGAATLNRYLKNPELTSSCLRDGWFRTGDLGRVDEAGYYYITGRIKDTIFRGGANIAPAEVEAVLLGHPGVGDVAVIGVPDRIYGEVPIAFIVPRSGIHPDADALTAYAASALADFKIPRHYEFVAALPTGKTGKIDKAALKERWVQQHGSNH